MYILIQLFNIHQLFIVCFKYIQNVVEVIVGLTFTPKNTGYSFTFHFCLIFWFDSLAVDPLISLNVCFIDITSFIHFKDWLDRGFWDSAAQIYTFRYRDIVKIYFIHSFKSV